MSKSKYRLTKEEVAAEYEEYLNAKFGSATNKQTMEQAKELRKKKGYEEMELTDVFTFGKYKSDKTLEEVIIEDSSYIEWMLKNTDRAISEEALDFLMVFGKR